MLNYFYLRKDLKKKYLIQNNKIGDNSINLNNKIFPMINLNHNRYKINYSYNNTLSYNTTINNSKNNNNNKTFNIMNYNNKFGKTNNNLKFNIIKQNDFSFNKKYKSKEKENEKYSIENYINKFKYNKIFYNNNLFKREKNFNIKDNFIKKFNKNPFKEVLNYIKIEKNLNDKIYLKLKNNNFNLLNNSKENNNNNNDNNINKNIENNSNIKNNKKVIYNFSSSKIPSSSLSSSFDESKETNVNKKNKIKNQFFKNNSNSESNKSSSSSSEGILSYSEIEDLITSYDFSYYERNKFNINDIFYNDLDVDYDDFVKNKKEKIFNYFFN